MPRSIRRRGRTIDVCVARDRRWTRSFRSAITVRASRRPTCRTSSIASIAGTAAKRRASGTGMGLWIARGLLAAERGRVWAENCADGGAQFTIVVPVPRQTGMAEPPTHDAAARILLVDDEVAIQRAVARCCARAATTWRSQAPAPRRCKHRRRDGRRISIVLDLGLPDLEGTEVCRRVRRLSKVPIVVLSARGARSGQGERARSGRRRLRHQAVRPRRAAGAHPRGAAPRDLGGRVGEPGSFRAGDLTIDYDRRRVLRRRRPRSG